MAQADATQKNVVHVISDQHIAACMGVEGHAQAITPNMDRLAAMGARFTKAYTQNPICTPSRVSMLSGQYCHNHGYYGLSGHTPAHLSNYLRHFKHAGYRTAGIGKLHMPNDPVDWVQPDCDFYGEAYSYRQPHHTTPYFSYLRGRGVFDNEDSRAIPELPGKQQHEARPSKLDYRDSVEGWCAQVAMDFISECKSEGKPFCMQVSLPRPHQCYTPDQRFWDMYDDDLDLPPTIHNDASHRPPHFRRMVDNYRRQQGQFEPKGFEHVARRVWRGYLACITQVDFALGEIIDHLKQLSLLDTTIVIYNSDHGAYSGTHGVPEKAPGICSESVCRVPHLWHAPGITKPATLCEHFIENIDIGPTITALADLPPMHWADGKDITPLLAGGDEPVRDVAVTEHVWSRAIRWRNWRLVHYQPTMFDAGGETDTDVGELYDIDADPDETRNLYHDPHHQATVHEGRRLLLEWLIDTLRPATILPNIECEDGSPAVTCDARESNTLGAQARVARGNLNYV